MQAHVTRHLEMKAAYNSHYLLCPTDGWPGRSCSCAAVLQLSITQEHQKLMQSCCHSSARDGIWRRILLVFCFQLVSEVCHMCVWVAACRTKIDNWRERAREMTNEGTHGFTKERRYGCTWPKSYNTFCAQVSCAKGRIRRLDPDFLIMWDYERVSKASEHVWYGMAACYVSANGI